MSLNVNNHNIFLIIGITFLVSVFMVFVSKKIAFHIGAVDKVKEEKSRRIHKNVLPRLGGLGMFLAFLFSYMFYGTLNYQMVSIIIGAFILILVGLFDDIKTMNNGYKLISHIIASCIIVFYGNLVLNNITLFGLGLVFPKPLNYLITIFFITACINIINLIDGLDGLAGGIASIYFATVSIIATILNQYGGLDIILALIMLGSTLGFLFHNFPPATTFAGDCGSQFMGYMIAVIALLGFKTTALTSFLIPVSILTIPIFDTLMAILRRWINGKRIGEADNKHFHYQFLKLKFSPQVSIILIYIITILFSIVSIFMALGNKNMATILYLLLCLILVFFVAKTDILFEHKRGVKNEKNR